MSSEEMAALFEAVMLSYFSHTDETVEKVLYDMINDTMPSVDEFELLHSELVLEVFDQVNSMAKFYFPKLGRGAMMGFLNGFVIADALQITDAVMMPNGILLIRMPLNHYQSLQHEINVCSPTN